MVIEWQCLLTERNIIFHKIVAEWSVQNSVEIFNLEDNEILEILLGAVNDTIKELDTDTWSRMMYNSKTFVPYVLQI